MKEIRCKKCNKLLFKASEDTVTTACKMEARQTELLTSQGNKVEIECKCPRCNGVNTVYCTRI